MEGTMKKRVLAGILSLLMVLSLVVPSGKAYASPESGYNDDVTKEGTDGGDGEGTPDESPDENEVEWDYASEWMNYLNGYDEDYDGEFSDEELAAVTELEIDNWRLPGMNGIERLTNLEKLSLVMDSIEGVESTIDLSANTKLAELSIAAYGLKNLELSANTELTKLSLSYGPFINSLDLSKNTKLAEIEVSGYEFESMFDISELPSLQKLRIWDVSFGDYCLALTNDSLEELTVVSGELDALDVSGLTNLKKLQCQCGLKDLVGLECTLAESVWLPENELDVLDVSYVENLKELDCYGNNLFALTLGSQALSSLICSENLALTILDFGTATITGRLQIDQTCVSEIDLSKFPDLKELFCGNSELQELDVSGNPELRILDCSNLDLEELNLENNPKLFSLNCTGNAIETLDIRNNPELLLAARGSRIEVDEDDEEYYSYRNGIGGVDYYNIPVTRELCIDKSTTLIEGDNVLSAEEQATVEMFPDSKFRAYVLEWFDEDMNCVIDSEELEAIAEVEYLDVSDCGIKDLTGIEQFSMLRYLDCSHNELTGFDLSQNIMLVGLSCNFNCLEELDLTKISTLHRLECYGNSISSLDITGNFSMNLMVDRGKKTEETETGLPETEEYSDGFILTDKYDGFDSYVISRGADENGEEDIVEISEKLMTDAGVTIVRNFSEEELAIFDMFPDGAFRAQVLYLYGYLGEHGQNYILEEDELAAIASAESLDVEECGIKSLQGIKYFTGLETLDCRNNELTELDLSANTNLRGLGCLGNNLDSIDLTGIEGLLRFIGTAGQLMTWYTPDDECLLTVYYSTDDDFYYIWADADVKLLPLSDEMQETMDRFPDVIFRQIVLSLFDEDGNNALDEDEMAAIAACEYLNVDVNEWTWLLQGMNISDLTGIEYFTGLLYFNCANNEKISAIDLSNCANLLYLSCSSNSISELDVSALKDLVFLNCENNSISELDVSQNEELVYLLTSFNDLEQLDISNNEKLVDAYTKSNGGSLVESIEPAPTDEDPEAVKIHPVYWYFIDEPVVTFEAGGHEELLQPTLSLDDYTKLIANVPSFSVVDMRLSSEIGLRFYVTIPEGFDAPDLHLAFWIPESTESHGDYTLSDAEKVDGTDNVYIFTCRLNPLQFSDDIRAIVYWDGNRRSVGKTSSCAYYCDAALEKYADMPALVELITALRVYAVCMTESGWTDGRTHTATELPEGGTLWGTMTDEETFALIKEGLGEETRATVDLADSEIDNVLISVTLEESTVINLYVLPKDGVTLVSEYAKTQRIGGKTYYVYPGDAKGPVLLNERTTFTIQTDHGTATITASPLSYVYSYLKAYSGDADKLGKCRAMAALYRYFMAAVVYVYFGN